MPDEQERPGAKGSAPPEDPRLAELTDQALHLLDELADARVRAASLAEWQGRCQELEARLAETRRHVRASRTARLVARVKQAPGTESLDLCLWAPRDLPAAERDRWLVRLKAFLEHRPAILLCPKDQRPADAVTKALPGLVLVDSEGPHPAQLWNLGLACGEAPLVLFLQAGAVPGKTITGVDLAAALDDNVALAQPVLTVKGKSPSLGLEDAGGVRPRPVGFEGETGLVPELELVAPEAFVVQRKSVLTVGPFDEDLQASAALVDFALRCRMRGKLVVGLPGIRIDLQKRPGSGLDFAPDRLVLLARHRPGEVLRELAAEPSVWERSEPELRAFARAVLGRLPDISPAAIAMLTEELVGLRRRVLSPADLAAQIAPIEAALAIGGDETGPPAEPRPRFARMLAGVQEVLTSSAGLVRDLAAESMRHQDAERRAEAARAEAGAAQSRAAEAHDHARAAGADAATARAESDAARADAAAARAASAASRAEAEASHADSLAARADAVAARAEATSAAAATTQARAEVEGLQKELAAGRRGLVELIERADEAAAAAEQRLAELLQRCEAGERRAAELERVLVAERELLARRTAELAERVGNPRDLHWPSLLQAVARTRQILGERESWIVILLEELAARRIKLRQRKLTPDEERFLAEHPREP